MTGILFIARLGSTRLPEKHLIKAGGKTFIEWLVARYAFEFAQEIKNNEVRLIICSSLKPENKNFEHVLADLPVEFFYGNDDNIPLRQLECAGTCGLTNIISVDGDDILCSSEAALKVYTELLKNETPAVKTSGLPLGMNLMGYSVKFLKGVVMHDSKFETGWGRIFDKAEVSEMALGYYAKNTDLRFTLDYEADSEFFKSIISFLKEKVISIKDKDLIQLVTDHRFFEINSAVNKEYWENFNREKEKEINTTSKKTT